MHLHTRQRDYQYANSNFRDTRLDESGVPKAEFRTATGHLDNHFTVGPAILWTPFLLVAHVGVLVRELPNTCGEPIAKRIWA